MNVLWKFKSAISDKILWEFQNFYLKIPLPPYTMFGTHNMAWRKSCSLFLNIVKQGKRVETQNCSNSIFSHIFCHWLSEKIWKNISVVFYSCFFLIIWKASNYPLRHYDISLNIFWSSKKQVKFPGRWDKIFIFQVFFK